MNSLRLLALLASSAALSFGAPIFCGAQNFNNGGGAAGQSVTLACPTLDAGAGNFISSVTLTRSGDAQTILTVGPNPIVTITWDAPTGVAGFGGIVFTATGSGSVGGGFTTSPTSPDSTTVSANFGQTLTISNGVTSILSQGGSLLNSGAVLLVEYTTSPNASPVPEPGTLALIGSALIGFSAIRRRS